MSKFIPVQYQILHANFWYGKIKKKGAVSFKKIINHCGTAQSILKNIVFLKLTEQHPKPFSIGMEIIINDYILKPAF